jgi:hypothetical protein
VRLYGAPSKQFAVALVWQSDRVDDVVVLRWQLATHRAAHHPHLEECLGRLRESQRSKMKCCRVGGTIERTLALANDELGHPLHPGEERRDLRGAEPCHATTLEHAVHDEF